MSDHEDINKYIEIVDAMDQLLDDMGPDGLCVCPFAKAKARIAFESFIDKEYEQNYMSLNVAEAIVNAAIAIVDGVKPK